MKILLITPHFYPENFRINDLAVELSSRGHEVTVLTGVPNYPEGKFYKGYGNFKNNRQTYKSIKIFRAPIIPRGSGGVLSLSINYLSFILGSLIMCVTDINKRKYDIIFVNETSPITIGIPAILIKKIQKIPIYFWVLDLWPESVFAAKNVKSRIVTCLLERIVSFIYLNCDVILLTSKEFITSIKSKVSKDKKIYYFPQWAESSFELSKNKIKKHNYFNIMFAGNVGEAQDFESIIYAAEKLKKYKHIKWFIVGSGSKFNWLQRKVKELGLKFFYLLGMHPVDEMPELFSEADAMILPLKNEYIFSLTIPGKLQTYLAIGKPIIGMANGAAAKIIKESGSGFCAESGDPETFAKYVLMMSNLKKIELDKMGKNALKYYNINFKREKLINQLEALMQTRSI